MTSLSNNQVWYKYIFNTFHTYVEMTVSHAVIVALKYVKLRIFKSILQAVYKECSKLYQLKTNIWEFNTFFGSEIEKSKNIYRY